MPVGTIDCWVFLSCLEVLNKCEKFTGSDPMKSYSLYTASLWDYSRRKVRTKCILHLQILELHCTCQSLGLLQEKGQGQMYITQTDPRATLYMSVSGTTPGERSGRFCTCTDPRITLYMAADTTT